MPTIKRIAAFVFIPLAAAGLFSTRPGAELHAQNSAAPSPPKTVDCEADTGKWISYPDTAELNGNVRFTQNDAVLKTDAAVALFDKDNNVISAKAQGPVHLYDTQDDLTGQHGSVDFTKHLATLRDNVVLVVKPGKSEANAAAGSPRRQFKDPATLTCQLMTYDYRFDVGRIPGPLTVTQTIQTKDDGLQTRTLTADAGLYNGKAETIQLVGDIKGTYSDGSIVQGDTRTKGKPVLINIKEGSESIVVPFHMQGHFTVKQSKNSKDDSAADDDGPDLSLPVPPPHTPAPGAGPAAPTPPAALTAPAGPATPSKTPPRPATPSPAAVPVQPAQGPSASAQTPPAAAPPAGSP